MAGTGVELGSSGLRVSVGDISDTAMERRSGMAGFTSCCLGVVDAGSSLKDADVGSSAFRVSMSTAPVPGREMTGSGPANSGFPLNSWNSVSCGADGISSPLALRCRFRRTKKTTAAMPNMTRNAPSTAAAMIAVRLTPESLEGGTWSLSLSLLWLPSELVPLPSPLPSLLPSSPPEPPVSFTGNDRVSDSGGWLVGLGDPSVVVADTFTDSVISSLAALQ